MSLTAVTVPQYMRAATNSAIEYVRRFAAPQCDVVDLFAPVDTTSTTQKGRYLKLVGPNVNGQSPNKQQIRKSILQQIPVRGMNFVEVTHEVIEWSDSYVLGRGQIATGGRIGMGNIEQIAADSLATSSQIWLEDAFVAAITGNSWANDYTGAGNGYWNDANFNLVKALQDAAFAQKQKANGKYPNTLILAQDTFNALAANPSVIALHGTAPYYRSIDATQAALQGIFSQVNDGRPLPFRIAVGRATKQSSGDLADGSETQTAIVPSGFAFLCYTPVDDGGNFREDVSLEDNCALKTIVAEDYRTKIEEIPGTGGTQGLFAMHNMDVVQTNANAGTKWTSVLSAT